MMLSASNCYRNVTIHSLLDIMILLKPMNYCHVTIYFPGMLSFVKYYVSTYHLCSHGKAPPRHAKHAALSPLPVPSSPWKSISCDFITDLLPSNGFDSVLVFVD